MIFTELVRPVEHSKAVAETSSLYEPKRKLEYLRRLRKTPELLQMLKSSRGFREKHCVYLGCSCLRQCLGSVLRTQQGMRWVLGINQFSHSYVLNLTHLENQNPFFGGETQKKRNRGLKSPSSYPGDSKREGEGGLMCELSALLHLVSPKHPLAAGGTRGDSPTHCRRWTLSSFPKRLELSLRMVLAFPKLSRMGRTLQGCREKREGELQ